ncbi:LuxR C-terminal-related transcriptional regulator [Zhengella sp. ZM62]|uniref:LuxR C-terminal-related transcriptional regulator n=1 Tax=Zhengella sedimenti TaxID=3390035 RepID=UPI0039749E20
MSNVIRLVPLAGGGRSAKPPDLRPGDDAGGSAFPVRPKHADLGGVARTHGFEAYAVLDIGERRGGLVFPRMRFHNLEDELAAQIGRIADLTQCSVFLMLGETNIPFPFTTGLDCRTNEQPDPSLLDDKLDTLLNMFGLRGGYCVPVCDPDARRSVVMYFGVREEMNSRYPGLVIDTIETFDAICQRGIAKGTGAGLSALELACLNGLARGLSMQDLATEVALSETAVMALARSLTRKLEAGSLYEALYKAGRMGLSGD